jgi:hypothetical protein
VPWHLGNTVSVHDLLLDNLYAPKEEHVYIYFALVLCWEYFLVNFLAAAFVVYMEILFLNVRIHTELLR